jgi:predicted amidophosphoribosyltransferase
VVCPQACVLCKSWVANPDLSPLCAGCLAEIHPLLTSLCDKCGVPVPGDLTDSFVLCSNCREGRFHFTRARSWGLYEGSLRRIIQAFKFDGFMRLAAPLSDFLRQSQAEHFPRIRSRPGFHYHGASDADGIRLHSLDWTMLAGKRMSRELSSLGSLTTFRDGGFC